MAAKPAPAPTLDLSVDDLAQGGDGVAHTLVSGERRAVFLRGVAPGDRVRARVDLRARPARGEVLELLAPGPDRVVPPCPDAGRCGGCHWMHIAPSAQASAHEQHVRRALATSLPIAFHAEPAPRAARTRARLHVRASGGRAIVGFHEAGSHDPVEVERCWVLNERLDTARKAIGPLLEGAHGTGEASLALGGPEGNGSAARRPVLDLTFDRDLPPACWARFEKAVADGIFAGIRVRAGGVHRAAVVGDATPWIPAVDGLPLRLAPGGFAQASEGGNAVLVGRVAALAKRALGEKADGLVVELYAGAGNLSVALAPLTSKLVTVESDEEACAAARHNLGARHLAAKVLVGDAATHTWSGPVALLVLDPPRAGAKAVADRLAKAAAPDARRDTPRSAPPLTLPKSILYVSCDPPTLGRDAGILAKAGYEIVAVELVEMFPHTSHIETVVLFERSRGRAKA